MVNFRKIVVGVSFCSVFAFYNHAVMCTSESEKQSLETFKRRMFNNYSGQKGAGLCKYKEKLEIVDLKKYRTKGYIDLSELKIDHLEVANLCFLYRSEHQGELNKTISQIIYPVEPHPNKHKYLIDLEAVRLSLYNQIKNWNPSGLEGRCAPTDNAIEDKTKNL